MPLLALNIGSYVFSDWRIPRLKRVSKSQQREKKKVQKRQAREESKDKEGLICSPEKSESESELFTEYFIYLLLLLFFFVVVFVNRSRDFQIYGTFYDIVSTRYW